MSSEVDRDPFRMNLLKYTTIAYKKIPEITQPSILDLGCGSGVQTIKLARMSGGEITAVDIDSNALKKLQLKSEIEGLSERIMIIEQSINDLSFLENDFDIIWAEGSIFVVGFEQGIREWREYLTIDGYLVIHDDRRNVSHKLGLVSKYGYHLVSHFDIPHEVWWEEYYAPLEAHINKLESCGVTYRKIREEIEMFKKSKQASNFFVLQKR